MEVYGYLALVVSVFIFFMIQTKRFQKQEQQKLNQFIDSGWGTKACRTYEHAEYEKIKKYYEYKILSKNVQSIDDITWNDLGMDDVYKQMNHTHSSAGEEVLYYLLRTPLYDRQEISNRNQLIKEFMECPSDSKKIQSILHQLGRTKKTSLYECLHQLKDMEYILVLPHIIQALLFLASIASFFFQPVAGMLLIITMMFINVGTYYRTKAKIEDYYICFAYLSDMMYTGKKLLKLDAKPLAAFCSRLQNELDNLSVFNHGMFLIVMHGSRGSLIDTIMDYIRMMLHVDIIKFCQVQRVLAEHTKSIDGLFETLGTIDAYIAIASYRQSFQIACEPHFSDSGKPLLHAKDLCHPLISNPISNDICADRSVLLTGSNASGKSTFLKAIAINAILAQSISFCNANHYEASIFKIYSSMALKDNLSGNESYYVVEIKSLKRIIDAVEPNIPVLCFVDEVLRGTNTIERIAASSQILKYINSKYALVFAATHDIELTQILQESYDNYHFTENLTENDVEFIYKLKKGPATDKNAILLLKKIGFSSEITNQANEAANHFVKTGEWQ